MGCRKGCTGLVVAGVWLLSVSVASAAPPDADEIWFESQVRPLLAGQCVTCHGPDKQESGLRVDSRAALLKGGDRGPAIVPGKAEESLLLHAVRRTPDLQMPPTAALRPPQVAALERWIARGAVWPKDAQGTQTLGDAWRSHWAFLPLRRPALPLPGSGAANPIDALLTGPLQEALLTLAPPADRRTLLRRASFDLLGLPPTPAALDEFVADPLPDAWERLVDRLLASPQYGERWGRYWLDVARYADNKGYVFFEEKSYPWAYTYRDYVIHALNADLPYDRFLQEQLAADLLPDAGDPQRLAALGFLTIGAHFMGNVHDIMDDRIDVVMRGLMGLTATCARCHDHKYDPLTQADYYGLYGVFRSTQEPLVPPLLTAPPDTDEYRNFVAELEKKQAPLDRFVRGKHAALVHGARTRVAEYILAAFAATGQPPTDDFMLIADPGDLNPAMIVRWQAYLDRWKTAAHPVWTPWWEFAAIPGEQFAAEAPRVAQQLQQRAGALHPLVVARLCDPPPTSLTEVANRLGELLVEVHREWQLTLAAAAEAGGDVPERLPDDQREALRQELYGPVAPANVPLVFGWGFLSLLPDRASQGEFQKLLKDVEQWLMKGPGAPPRAMVLLDAAPFEPKIFLRGNPSRPGDAVRRRFPKAFAEREPAFTQGSGRWELAQAITSPQNPLTARVIANRIWQHHFGTGLVRTPADFGLRSDPPTHPELLDFLATELIDRGWSLKALHRLVLTSAAYQQSSQPSPAALAADPDNRLWSRFPRQRLDLEGLRDNLLAVSDHLDDRLGGPSVGIWDGFNPRRTLYASIDRQDLPNVFTAFDFPAPAATSAERATTTVAPQSLFLLNGPLTLQAASALLQRPDVAHVADPDARIRRIFRLALGREPSADELQRVTAFVTPPTDHERWLLFVHSLLLTNEFCFVD